MAKGKRLYVLIILTTIYMFNLIDRNLISVLAPYIKADLSLTDAQIALLYGTAFSLFYGLFGLPLSRLADNWNRVKTLSFGLALWSFMTSISGLVGSISQLGIARAGVGVGETSSSPAAISLICEHFSAKRRGTAMAVFSTAVYIGGGISLVLGGAIVSGWAARFGTEPVGMLGLTGWRAAFIIVGLPGLLLAVLTYFTVREPERETASSGLRDAVTIVGQEAATIIPPWSYFRLNREAPNAARSNLVGLALIVCTAAALIFATDHLLSPERRQLIASPFGIEITTNTVQWISMAIACYGTLSWIQLVAVREPRTYAAIIGSSSYRALMIGGAAVATGMHALNAFTFLYAVRYLDAEPSFAIRLGIIAATSGLAGTMLGGAVGDRLRERFVSGRVTMLILCYVSFGAASMVEYSTDDMQVFQIAYALATLTLSGWAPLINATAQDLLSENERGRGYAALQLGTAVIGLGFGPYLIGMISDDTGSLRLGILTVILGTMPVAVIAFSVLAKGMKNASAQRSA